MKRNACDMWAICVRTVCVRLNATVHAYILGTHYQENQCMTLVYSERLLINLRPHSILSHFRQSTDTRTCEHTQKHTNQYTQCIQTAQSSSRAWSYTAENVQMFYLCVCARHKQMCVCVCISLHVCMFVWLCICLSMHICILCLWG